MTAADDEIPLSWPQEVLWLAERMRPGSVLDPRCEVHRALTFPNEPDLDLVREVLDDLVARHDALRTVPRRTADGVRLRPVAPAPVALTVRDLPADADDEEVGAAVTAVTAEPFDLDRGPLLRVAWLRRGRGGVLVVVVHHWAGDGRGLDLLLQDAAALWAARRDGRPPPPPPTTYAEVARRQRSAPLADDDEIVGWWRGTLAGARRGALPVADGRTRAGTTCLVTAPLADEAHHALLAAASRHRASPFMVLLAALAAFLDDGRGHDRRDLTVFTVDAGRDRTSRDVVGFLAEPLPLRLRLDRTQPLDPAVGAARRAVLDALGHRGTPLLVLLAAAPRLAVSLLGGRRPATLVQYLPLTGLALPPWHGEPLPTFSAAVGGEPYHLALPVDLDVTFERHGDAHSVAALFDPGLWSPEEVTSALAGVERVLVEASRRPGVALCDLVGLAAP